MATWVYVQLNDSGGHRLLDSAVEVKVDESHTFETLLDVVVREHLFTART